MQIVYSSKPQFPNLKIEAWNTKLTVILRIKIGECIKNAKPHAENVKSLIGMNEVLIVFQEEYELPLWKWTEGIPTFR